jgi:hypothetical protein
MPLLSTLGNASAGNYGSTGIQPGGSALINANGAGLRVPASNNFAYGTGNFTIEMWIYPFNYNEFANVLWAQTQSRPSYFLIFLQQNTGQVSFQWNGSVRGTSGNAVTLNAWNHVALVRNSNIVRIYVNGTGSGQSTIADNISNTTFNPTIGRYSHNETIYSFNGYVTNVRVAKSAIYTANFEPSQTPFTRTSQGATNVQLLLNHKSSSRFLVDDSVNNLTVTNVSGLASFSTLSPYTVPYVVPPTVIISEASVTPNTTVVGEGQSVVFTIAGTNTPNGTYYYTIEQAEGADSITAADFTSGSLTGSFTISGNSGSITLTLSNDLTTEGTENFVLFVRSGSTSGIVIGSSPEITVIDESITPVFTVAPASTNENDNALFTVANVGADGTYYWTVLNGTTTNADFSAVSGSFIVSGSTGGIDNGSGSFNVSVVGDRTTEGVESFQVQVRSGSTSGPVIITSTSVNIIDTSLTPAFTVTPASINEGSSGSFTVNNLGAPGTYYWTILNGTTTNADFSAVSGTFTTSTFNGDGSFLVNPVIDYTTEGAETFQVQIREGSVAGTVLVTSSPVTINDTSTTVSASGSPTSFNEGNSTTITASATAFPNGTYYWTILNGTTTNADFTATSGSFTVSNGTSGAFTVTATTLGGAEVAETFQVQIRRDSTSGTVIATTGTLTINANST